MNFKLNNNLEIPAIAFGTYNVSDDLKSIELSLNHFFCSFLIKTIINLVSDLVEKAIDVGFHHFDTASIYRNEEQVGEAISKHDKKANLFITSKLPMNGFRDEKVDFYLRRSLNKLRRDHLDLYLMHAPFAIKVSSLLISKDLILWIKLQSEILIIMIFCHDLLS